MTDISPEVREKIERAAEGLYAELGRLPAATDVRARAGGAMNVVGIVVREWKAKIKEKEAQATQSADEPDAVKEAIVRAGRLIWVEAQNAANEELEHARADAQRDIRQLQNEIMELSDSYDALLDQHEDAQAQLASLRDQLAKARELEGVLAEVRKQLAAAEARATTERERASEAERKAATLEGELNAIRATNNRDTQER